MLTNLTRNATQSDVDIKGNDDRRPDRVRTTQATLSIVLNATFLIVLATNRDLIKNKRMTYHVGNLAVADMLLGLSTFCSNLVQEFKNVSQVSTYLTLISDVSSLVSFAAVLLMGIERAVVIRKPFTWFEILPLKRVLSAMVGGWVAMCLLCVTFRILKARMAVTFVALLLVCLTIAINIYIYKKVQLETRRLMTVLNNHERACILLLIIVAIMVVTVLPFLLFSNILNICDLLHLKCNLVSNNHLQTISYSLQNLANMNFIVNPIVYIWNDRTYREAFCRTFKQSHSNINIGTHWHELFVIEEYPSFNCSMLLWKNFRFIFTWRKVSTKMR